MTTGFLRIIIDNKKIEGNFEDGKIIDGMIETDNCVFSGGFNSDGKLHGHGVMQIVPHGNFYVGSFENGSFIKGKKYYKDILIEEGNFQMRGNTPYLITGSKYSESHYSYSGTFKYGALAKGIASYKNIITYDGEFDYKHMYRGTVIYKNIAFKASYSISYDNFDEKYVLNHCNVEYTGDIRKLNKKQLMLYLCQGDCSLQASKFYNAYLDMYDNGVLKYLSNKIFPTLVGEYHIGLLHILENIKKYEGSLESDDTIEVDNPKEGEMLRELYMFR